MTSRHKAAKLAKAKRKRAEALVRYKNNVIISRAAVEPDPLPEDRDELIQAMSNAAREIRGLGVYNQTSIPGSPTCLYEPISWTNSITINATTSSTASTSGWYIDNCRYSTYGGWPTASTVRDVLTYHGPGAVDDLFNDYSRQHIWRQMSPEERARHEEAERRREEERKKAEATAEVLLLRHLNPEQREEYRQHKYFHVEVAGRRYRIDKGWAGNVKLIEGGKVAESLCIHPIERIPDQDNMLGQKLLLEWDEEEFRRTANISNRRPRPPRRPVEDPSRRPCVSSSS